MKDIQISEGNCTFICICTNKYELVQSTCVCIIKIHFIIF